MFLERTGCLSMSPAVRPYMRKSLTLSCIEGRFVGLRYSCLVVDAFAHFDGLHSALAEMQNHLPRRMPGDDTLDFFFKAWPFEAHLNPGSGDGVGHKLLFLVAV